jgi:8-amino-7-oxononanoate synthase
LGLAVPAGDSPIIPVPIGSDDETFAAYHTLLSEGIYVNPVTHPAVPRGEGILRLSLRATHTQLCLTRLFAAFHKLSRHRAATRIA